MAALTQNVSGSLQTTLSPAASDAILTDTIICDSSSDLVIPCKPDLWTSMEVVSHLQGSSRQMGHLGLNSVCGVPFSSPVAPNLNFGNPRKRRGRR
eukprot:scaffold2059_cov64-Cyclotella_meneghiniana.AAC.5